MKKLLIIMMMLMLPCCSSTQLIESWKNPDIDTYEPYKILIVGKDPPESFVELEALPNVHVTGGVPEVASYYNQADIAIVPLRTGGGTRIKILEALSYKIPIIFMSAHEDPLSTEKALEAGAVAYLQKPFEGQLLLEKINQALSILPTVQDHIVKNQQGALAPTMRKD